MVLIAREVPPTLPCLRLRLLIPRQMQCRHRSPHVPRESSCSDARRHLVVSHDHSKTESLPGPSASASRCPRTLGRLNRNGGLWSIATAPMPAASDADIEALTGA